MLQQVKDYLKITWDDEDAEISRMIDRGKAHINDLVGTELEYEVVTSANEAYETALAVVKPTPAVSLLLDYCRYAYNNASEYFEENFQKEILRLQLKTGVSLLPVEGEENEV